MRSLPGVSLYALVIIEGFGVSGTVAFPADLGPICRALDKRHGDQDTTLQFGRRNWLERELSEQADGVGPPSGD